MSQRNLIYNPQTNAVERYSTIHLSEAQKGGTLLVAAQDDALRAPQEEAPKEEVR